MQQYPAWWTYDPQARAWYFAPAARQQPARQMKTEAVIDIDADGALAGVELIDGAVPPPPTSPVRHEPGRMGRASGRGAVGDGPDGSGMRKAPRDMLADIGRALHGEHWRLPLARGVEVDDDTIRRWMSGRTVLPRDHGVFADALRLIEQQQSALEDIHAELVSWMK